MKFYQSFRFFCFFAIWICGCSPVSLPGLAQLWPFHSPTPNGIPSHIGKSEKKRPLACCLCRLNSDRRELRAAWGNGECPQSDLSDPTACQKITVKGPSCSWEKVSFRNGAKTCRPQSLEYLEKSAWVALKQPPGWISACDAEAIFSTGSYVMASGPQASSNEDGAWCNCARSSGIKQECVLTLVHGELRSQLAARPLPKEGCSKSMCRKLFSEYAASCPSLYAETTQ